MNEHIQMARLQNRIMSHLGLDGERLIFEYQESGPHTTLNLITINPVHDQSFLFKAIKAVNKVEALEKMLAYVESYKDRESCYTIQWSNRGERQLHTSYFRGGNIYEVLDKFHYGQDPNASIIYSIVLSPVS